MRPVVRVDNLSKVFPVYRKPSDIVLEALTRTKRHDEFWALKDVSFIVNEKQRLGIIGPNGSGKSTLLKILTGHLSPTTGSVSVEGKVSAMLSLNTILNPEETGLSNIKFNLMLNGAPKTTIDQLAEEIIEFTELGQFIYAPVRTYSSGMNAKLAFAINTALEPEILVIDEVLSVGDAYFVGKATKRMIELCDKGKALIFVSHSNAAVQMLCDTVLWLDNGSIRMHGPADRVLAAYEEDFRRQDDVSNRDGNASRAARLANLALPSELGSSSLYRVRLRPSTGVTTFHDTHYVRSLKINGGQVPLSVIDGAENTGKPQLDVLGSEWGRFYNKEGHDCRVLSAQTGRKRGGQVIVPLPSGETGDHWAVNIEFESASILGREQLVAEVLDYVSGTWREAETQKQETTPDGWQRVEARVSVPLVDDDKFHEVVALAEQSTRPNAEIANVVLLVNGKETTKVTERAPFVLRVEVRVNGAIASADVGIKITRADGVYIFWQSSGLVGVPITAPTQKINVEFDFDQNLFSSAKYQVSAYVANGWNFPENYPYSEMFDRKIGILNFTVTNEIAGLDFGAINQRVPVSITKEEV